MNDMRNILFDLDGTLIHSLPGIVDTIQATLRSLGKNPSSGQAFQSLVGYPLETVFEKLLGADDPDIGLAVRKYRELYMVTGLSRAYPFRGVPKMLEGLRAEGRSLFIVTARNETVARMILRDHGLDGLILSVRGERAEERWNSKADLVAEVMMKHGLAASDTTVVGDRHFDIEAALANGCMPIGVTYGYGTREELIDGGTEVLLDSVEELAEYLMKRK